MQPKFHQSWTVIGIVNPEACPPFIVPYNLKLHRIKLVDANCKIAVFVQFMGAWQIPQNCCVCVCACIHMCACACVCVNRKTESHLCPSLTQ